MHHPHPIHPAFTASCRPLADAYTELLGPAFESDSSLSPLALASGGRKAPLQPLHGSTVRTLGALSRTVTGDDEAFPALLQSLRKLYHLPGLSASQLAVLLELAVRPHDLATAAEHGLTVVVTRSGHVWTQAGDLELHFEADLWSFQTGRTTAYHPALAPSLRLAQYLRRRTTKAV